MCSVKKSINSWKCIIWERKINVSLLVIVQNISGFAHVKQRIQDAIILIVSSSLQFERRTQIKVIQPVGTKNSAKLFLIKQVWCFINSRHTRNLIPVINFSNFEVVFLFNQLLFYNKEFLCNICLNFT